MPPYAWTPTQSICNKKTQNSPTAPLNLDSGERMFDRMSWSTLSTDQIEQRLLSNQGTRGRLDVEDMGFLEELDRRQVATADGCKPLSEWAAARLDIGLDNARQRVRTMRRTVDRSELRDVLESGETTFDRVEALSSHLR